MMPATIASPAPSVEISSTLAGWASQLSSRLMKSAPSAPIELTLEKARRGVALRVSNRWENVGSIDTGKLFDRFYRADPARTAGGFGIGLSIARSIAEGHRGAISARTEGDTITFTALLK